MLPIMVVSNKGVLQMYTEMKNIEMSNFAIDEDIDFEIEWDSTISDIKFFMIEIFAL